MNSQMTFTGWVPEGSWVQQLLSQGSLGCETLWHKLCSFYFLFWSWNAACGILLPRPGIEPAAPALEVRNLNHWTAREVPNLLCSCSPAPKLSEPYYLGVLYTWAWLIKSLAIGDYFNLHPPLPSPGETGVGCGRDSKFQPSDWLPWQPPPPSLGAFQ